MRWSVKRLARSDTDNQGNTYSVFQKGFVPVSGMSLDFFGFFAQANRAGRGRPRGDGPGAHRSAEVGKHCCPVAIIKIAAFCTKRADSRRVLTALPE
jgi:hypothetical protein